MSKPVSLQQASLRLKTCPSRVYKHLETFNHSHAADQPYGWSEEWCKLQSPDGRVCWWLKAQLEVVK